VGGWVCVWNMGVIVNVCVECVVCDRTCVYACVRACVPVCVRMYVCVRLFVCVCSLL